jgi:hypothetical protein
MQLPSSHENQKWMVPATVSQVPIFEYGRTCQHTSSNESRSIGFAETSMPQSMAACVVHGEMLERHYIGEV